jgi:hypothetical protein
MAIVAKPQAAFERVDEMRFVAQEVSGRSFLPSLPVMP